MTHNKHQVENLINERSKQGLEEQINAAIQVLSEIENINSSKAFALVESRIRKESIKGNFLNIISRIAAILFIPLLITTAWLFYQQNKTEASLHYAMQEITSPLGVRSQVVLPDGSAVWLNAESTIRFKVPFDTDSRNVELIGEAFFDVKKDTRRPFQVESGQLKVSVLGTRFNFKAFTEDNNIEVVLEEGKISLAGKDGKHEDEQIMNPGERAVIDKTTFQTKITTEKIGKYLAWQSGKLVFDECPMPEVVQQLERWFGIEVKIVDPKILTYKITTTFENEPLHQVLELLALSSPIKVDYISAKIDKSNQIQSKAKVIITSKK